MLLERLGLHQCQGNCVQPFRSKSRVHLEGASAVVQQEQSTLMYGDIGGIQTQSGPGTAGNPLWDTERTL